jgi:hypothetical protein
VTAVALLGLVVGIGLLGVVAGLRSPAPSLDAAWSAWQEPPGRHDLPDPRRSMVDLVGRTPAHWLLGSPWADHPRITSLRGAVAVTGSDPSLFVSRLVVVAGAATLAPLVLWSVLLVLGAGIPLAAALVMACLGAPLSVGLMVAALVRKAETRRRHVRVVLGSFIDLVVLSLAGGVGIDGALHAASRATPDWVARRIAATLSAARDGGEPPWGALGSLGAELGVPELEELATTVQLAGTEGARIRQALTARGASLRRHEQAEAESAANSMTERLFLPGALLLLGFLVFIGYPAVDRILSGF